MRNPLSEVAKRETSGYAVREDCLYGCYSRDSVVVGYDFVDS